MKNLLLSFAFIFLSIPTLAQVPDPESFCKINSGCTETMNSYMTDFRNGGVKPDFSKGPLVASGTCHHLQSGINPNQAHHGLLVLDSASRPVLFQALFSYFAASNPYADLNFEKATALALSRGSRPTPMKENTNDFQAEYHSAEYDILYWTRSLPEKNQVLLISTILKYGQGVSYSFCRLETHAHQ